ncbi:hypothetical protein [Paludibaculum fermentans]|uniref:hypothetical protein n=1 Tax=Paludibaculum fermentans TaxID=1473598 RepID=UPI003EBED004
MNLRAQAPIPPVLTTAHGTLNTLSPLAPGGFVILEGTGFAEKELQALVAPYPAKLAGVRVTANGLACPLVSVSPTRAVALLPMALADPAAPDVALVLTNDAGSTEPFAATWGLRPVILTADREDSGAAVVLDETLTPLSSVAAGQTVILPVTGLGPTEPAVADGAATPVVEPLPAILSPVRVFFGDAEAQVVSATLAAGQVALYHVKVIVPEGGDGSVAVMTDNRELNRVNLPVPAPAANATEVSGSIESMFDAASMSKVTWSPLFTAAKFNVKLTLAPGAKPFKIELKAPVGGITVQVDPATGTWTASAGTPIAQTRQGDFSGTGITVWDFLANLPMPGSIVPLSRMPVYYFSTFPLLALPNQPSSLAGMGLVVSTGTIPAEGPLVLDSATFPAAVTAGSWVPLNNAVGSRPTGIYTAVYTLLVDGVEVAKAGFDNAVQP